jgi:hypothetical protein
MYLHNGENRSSLARSVVELLQKYPRPLFFWTDSNYVIIQSKQNMRFAFFNFVFGPGRDIRMEVLARWIEEFLDPDQDHSSETASLTYLSPESNATNETFSDHGPTQTRRL